MGTHALVKIAATSRTKAPILPQQVTNVVSKPMQYGGPTPSVSSPRGMRPYAFARTRYFFSFLFFPALIVHKLPSPAPLHNIHAYQLFQKSSSPVQPDPEWARRLTEVLQSPAPSCSSQVVEWELQ